MIKYILGGDEVYKTKEYLIQTIKFGKLLFPYFKLLLQSSLNLIIRMLSRILSCQRQAHSFFYLFRRKSVTK